MDKPNCTAEERDKYKDSVIRTILDFTQCHPYYTQQLSAAVFNLMQYDSCFEDVVEKAVNMQVSEHDLDYERLWIGLNLTDRKILTSLSLTKNRVTSIALRTSTTYSALQRLVKKGYVIKTDSFEIEDPFFSVWIQKKNN